MYGMPTIHLEAVPSIRRSQTSVVPDLISLSRGWSLFQQHRPVHDYVKRLKLTGHYGYQKSLTVRGHLERTEPSDAPW